MRVLAVDTTSDRGSVALVDADGVRIQIEVVAAPGHAERLLPAIELLLSETGIQLGELEGYAVAIGPGSFTGLRVGISTIQGLALAARRPCSGVSTLDALGRHALDLGRPVAAMVDAFRGEVFGALYAADGSAVEGPLLSPPAAFVERVVPGAVYVGSGADRYAEVVASHDASARVLSPAPLLAGSVGLVAGARFRRREGVEPESLRPLYVRDAGIRPSAP